MTAPQARLEALLQLTALERLPRTGWILRGVPAPQTVAGHSLGVAQLVLALAPELEPGVDLGRALAMAVLHDAPEAWTGDLPSPAGRHLPAGAKAAMEAAVAERGLEPLGSETLEAWREIHEGSSREARLVHACDRLQLGIELLRLVRLGTRGLEEFEAVLQTLECADLPPAEALRQQLLAELEAAWRGPRP